MYIKSVRLQNVCCFEDVTLDFEQPSDTGHWISILGDNGIGKTTVLRSIALGLHGETSASALHRELYADWVRYQAETNEAVITIEFTGKLNGEVPWVETTITRAESGHTEVHQKNSVGVDFPWHEMFVSGYGPVRAGFVHQDFVEYSAVDSVYSLFNYGSSLQNPELVLRRLNSEELLPVLRAIDRILLLPEGSTKLTRLGLVVEGQWLEEVGIGGWGDGHRTMFCLIADLFGWAALFDREMLKTGITGAVLIDELEQHLHPSWQRNIVGQLRHTFPKVQFITTTHSPLCVIGTTALEDEECDLFLLEKKGDTAVRHVTRTPPRGLRADQVLTSYLFGLPSTSDDETTHAVQRLAGLLAKIDRDEREEQEVAMLRAKLESQLGTGETELQRVVERAVTETLTKLVETELEKIPIEAARFEIRRQLAAIFGKEAHA